jgi:hypothetical protein
VVLEQGVHHHGTDWATIRRKFLPHRDEAQLRDTWENKLCPAAKDRARASELPLPPPPPVFGARPEPAAAGGPRGNGGAGPSTALLPIGAANPAGPAGGRDVGAAGMAPLRREDFDQDEAFLSSSDDDSAHE